ncbi:hypothetical protein EDB19DRAFT_1727228 [Suillus lakei]|nr:hypothetical protein EDB19DRAFT_1727228 [Suillus lakei]
MEPPTPITFRFRDLPTELALLVFTFAAEPDFAQPDTYATKNPYSAALSVSRVSKLVRRVVLPRMLHTVLLPEPRQVTAFVQALRMQKIYIEQQQHDLSVDYTSRVHRMWIGMFRGPLQDANTVTPSAAKPGSDSDVSLLAPVILAAPSLAVDFLSLDVLLACLKHASNCDVDLNVEPRNSVRPWSTKSLTLSGGLSLQWSPFMKTVHGNNFLASISHLTFLSSSSHDKSRHFQGSCVSNIGSQDSEPMLPLWMAGAPFKRLQTFSRIIPHIDSELPVAERTAAAGAQETQVKLEIQTFKEPEVGSIPSGPLLLVSCIPKLCRFGLDCEKLWACGCEGPSD